MAEKRTDKRGRILKSGESQRADGTYQYRYKDCVGKLHYVYASTLDKLRKKKPPSKQIFATALITRLVKLQCMS